MITIGLRGDARIGEIIEGVWLRGVFVTQPCRIMGPSTFDAWVKTYTDRYGEPPSAQEIASAQRGDARFYLVSTD